MGGPGAPGRAILRSVPHRVDPGTAFREGQAEMTNISRYRRRSLQRRSLRRAFAFAVVLAAGSGRAESSPPVAITLSEALEAAAERSHASAAARLDVESAREATRKARAAYLPSFGVSGGWFGRDH